MKYRAINVADGNRNKTEMRKTQQSKGTDGYSTELLQIVQQAVENP